MILYLYALTGSNRVLLASLVEEILQIFSKSYKIILFDLCLFVGFLRPTGALKKLKINHSKFKSIMTTKTMASTAKKRATIIAMAAIAGASVSQTSAAARQALADMREEMGKDNHVYSLNYTWDPFDGLYA